MVNLAESFKIVVKPRGNVVRLDTYTKHIDKQKNSKGKKTNKDKRKLGFIS